jgi:hypothetical protein
LGLFPPRRAIQLQDRFEPAFEDLVLHAIFVVFAAAKLALDLDVRALPEASGEVAQFPKGEAAMPFGPRFHSPSAFFHERFVATENTVKVDPLLPVFVSASPPVNPMRVSLLRYMMFFSPVLPVWPGAPES